MNKAEYFQQFFNFLESSLRGRCQTMSIADEVDLLERQGGIPAQKMPGKGKFEEIFTSVFLTREIAQFHLCSQFRDIFDLSDEEIRAGLAYEGWKQDGLEHFGSSPIIDVGFKTVLSKSATGWKGSWGRPSTRGELPNLAPCPDIALKPPLPFSAVGDVKYFRGDKTEGEILKELHLAVKEVFFYYAVMNIGRDEPFYKNGLLIVADATTEQTVMKTIKGAMPGLADRLFNTPGFYMKVLEVNRINND
jgi:hypothetical protein